MTIDKAPAFNADEMKGAGLTPQVLGRLLDISRVTASYWLNGHRQPHPLLRRKIEILLEGVRREVQIGTLPPSIVLPPRVRKEVVESVLAKYFA